MWHRWSGFPSRKLPGVIMMAVLAVLIVVSIGMSTKVFEGLRKPKEKTPLITCSPDDYKDTPFIIEVKNNETVLIPPTTTLMKLTLEELAVLYHRYVENLQYFCKRIIRLGSVQDGGWDVCDEDKYRPRPPCLVYSFGINNDFTFDDAVIQEYGCEVHSFDPSMKTKSYQRSKLNYFHDLGIAAEPKITKEGWELQDLDTIRANLEHTQRPITILKMDIELWEWEVLPSILGGEASHAIDNFLIEVHLNLYGPHSTESGRDEYLRALKNLKLLYDAGFRIFRTHRNPTNVFVSKCRKIQRANCHELHLVRLKR